MDIVAPQTILILATIFCSAVLRGFSGFGFSLAAVPVLTNLMSVQEAVPLVLGLEAVGLVPILPRLWRSTHWMTLGHLFLGALVLLPLGLIVLEHGAPTLIRPVIYMIVLVSVWAIWHPPHLSAEVRDAKAWPAVVAGGVSGFLNGLAGMSGPPVILYLLNGERSHQTARSTMMAFFPLSAALTLMVGSGSGVYIFPDWPLLLLTLPCLVVGTEIGILLQRRIDGTRARQISLLVLAGSALLNLITFLFSLL